MTKQEANETLRHAAISGPSWVYHRQMSQADRDAFDRLLVETQHPLAYQAGSQWYRFEKLARSDFRFTA